jgi:hypothetical protein
MKPQRFSQKIGKPKTVMIRLTMIFEAGKKYQCVLSKSPGYKVGEVYECKKDDNGMTYMIGSDGFKDYTKNLLSNFRVMEQTKVRKIK